MRTLQSLETRKQKKIERNRRWRARKEQLHIARTKDEPIRGEWRGKFAFTISVQGRINGQLHVLDFYISDKRINSFRVHRDGEPWKTQISASRALAGLRKALPRFALHT